MTHEPECIYRPAQYARVGGSAAGYEPSLTYIPSTPCICIPLRAHSARTGQDVTVAAGLHKPWLDPSGGPLDHCSECGRKYPCLTAKTLRLVYVDGVLTPLEEDQS